MMRPSLCASVSAYAPSPFRIFSMPRPLHSRAADLRNWTNFGDDLAPREVAVARCRLWSKIAATASGVGAEVPARLNRAPQLRFDGSKGRKRNV